MPIQIDLITRKKLILVKQLYQQAVIQSASQNSYVNRIMSLIGFDLAAETVLKAVVTTLEPSKSVDNSFQSLVQQADKLMADAGLNPIPDKANIQHVHTLRNDAQHKAKYPNETDVSDCRTYVRDFLQKIIFEVWGLQFETISLAEVIQHSKIKEYLVDAETALDEGKHRDALIKAEAGFSTALRLIKPAIVGRMDSSSNPNLAFVPFDKNQKSTYELLEMLRDFIVRSAVGLNILDYMKYRGIVDSTINLFFMADGHYDVHLLKDTLEPEDVDFAVAYAINAVVQIESIVGNFDAPFGSNDWH